MNRDRSEKAEISRHILALASRGTKPEGRSFRLITSLLLLDMKAPAVSEEEQDHETFARIVQVERLFRLLVQEEDFGLATAKVVHDAAIIVAGLTAIYAEFEGSKVPA